jgi:hypothetical protein
MSAPDAAQLISAFVLVLVLAALARTGRRDAVAQAGGPFMLPDGTAREVTAGTVIARGGAMRPSVDLPVKAQHRSWLGAILVGKDHRTSTSKTVAFAWTLALAFGLMSLLVAVWLGDHDPWDAQIDRGLQEEYLLLLGGPFAAAILAKQVAVSQNEAKTDAPVGEANASQLVNDDQGETDLGDFQYVLFNLIALAFFLGDFIGDLAGGFPALPAILTGLALTSTGGYGAKKLIAQAAPTLTSVLPNAAPAGAEIQVFGTNLAVPASSSDTGELLGASVRVGPHAGELVAHDLVLGNDRLTVKIPGEAMPGPAPISAVRADGVAARAPSGMNVLPFTVLAPGPQASLTPATTPAVETVAG